MCDANRYATRDMRRDRPRSLGYFGMTNWPRLACARPDRALDRRRRRVGVLTPATVFLAIHRNRRVTLEVAQRDS